jgi:4a-hydroxytetrahydrobiopterin dehydratase
MALPILDPSVSAVREVERRPREPIRGGRPSPEGRAAAVPARLPRELDRDPDHHASEEAGSDRYRDQNSDEKPLTRNRLTAAREMETLTQMKCVACRKDEPTVTDAEIAGFHPQVPDWEIVELDGIKTPETRPFLRRFCSGVGVHEEGRRACRRRGVSPRAPDRMGQDDGHLVDAQIKGVHRNDFVMAAKTDELYQPRTDPLP